MENKPLYFSSDDLVRFSQDGLQHGFFTKCGGVSKGIFESLNTAYNTKDSKENVFENRTRIAKIFSLECSHLITAQQIHSNKVTVIDEKNYTKIFACDALVTKLPNLGLGVLTADCGPVLFYDYRHHIIAAAHAGWRGAFHDIIENTVQAIESLGGKRQSIRACLGPCISVTAYEVRNEFRKNFLETEENYNGFFIETENENVFLFNLKAFIFYKCKKAGIYATALEKCTYQEDDLFFSYRKSQHRQEEDYGRQISVISLS